MFSERIGTMNRIEDENENEEEDEKRFMERNEGAKEMVRRLLGW